MRDQWRQRARNDQKDPASVLRVTLCMWLTIIIPVFRAQGKLATTLSSLKLEEAPGIETIVVDGSTCEATKDLLSQWQPAPPNTVRLISEPDAGIYDAMNKGIRHSEGAYLFFLGAGDTLLPGVLKEMRRRLPEDKLSMCYGNVLRDEGVYDGPFDNEKLSRKNICHQAIFYSREVFALLGLFNQRYPACADWEFNMRCFGSSRISKLYLPLTVARFEGGGLSSQGDPAFKADHWRLVWNFLGPAVVFRAFSGSAARKVKRMVAKWGRLLQKQ